MTPAGRSMRSPASAALSSFYESFHRDRSKSGTVALAGRIEFIVARVGQGKRVLDLGCRNGALAAHFAQDNEVVGVDIDRAAAARCSRRLGIETRVADLNGPLEFPDASFDAAVLSEVLEHLPYPDLVLAEIRRILRPDGLLVGSVPNGTRLPNRLSFLLRGVVERDPTHLWHYGPSSLRAKLAARFNAVEIGMIGGRFRALCPSLLAKYIVFCARGPLP